MGFLCVVWFVNMHVGGTRNVLIWLAIYTYVVHSYQWRWGSQGPYDLLRLSFDLFCVISLAKNGESESFFTSFHISFCSPWTPNFTQFHFSQCLGMKCQSINLFLIFNGFRVSLEKYVVINVVILAITCFLRNL